MVKIGVCDDNKHCLETIKLLFAELENKQNFEICYFMNAVELLKRSNDVGGYDILFIDIEMPDKTGLECVKEINEHHPKTIVIFTTNHSSYVSDTFRLKTFQFLIKPIEKDLFYSEFNRAVEEYKKQHTKLQLNNKNRVQVVEYGEILYIDVRQKKITIHTEKEKITSYGRLKSIYDQLRLYDFEYCHQSIIVNLAFIKAINKDTLILKNYDEAILVSRKNKSNLLKKFTLYMTRCNI